MGRLVAVGNCVLDTILSVPHFVVEDDKIRASAVTKRRGGNCPNTIDVLEQLCSVEGKIGAAIDLSLVVVLPNRSSSAVQDIQRSFGPGVDLTKCIYQDEYVEPSSSYIIKNLASDTRTIISYNAMPDMTLNEFTQIADSLGGGPLWYHFEGRIPDVTLACIRHLRKSVPGAKISVEIEKFPREGLRELVPEADVVFYSKTWAVGNGYHDPMAFLQEQAKLASKAHLLCCTWGSEGAAVLETATRTYLHHPAWLPPNSSVVDTIGAGDTFIAGMLYSCLSHQQDWSLSRKLDFANELAGRKVVQEGFAGLGELMSRGKGGGELL